MPEKKIGHLSVKQINEDEYFETFNFGEFDPIEHIIKAGVKNATMTLTGKRRTGKSYFIRAMYYALQKYYVEVYLFSGTSEAQLDFWDFIKPKNIFQGIDEEALNKIWSDQEKRKKNSKETDPDKMPHVMIIFDDVIQDNTGVRSSDFLCKMYSNGRHLNIFSILATQSLKAVSRHSRDNTDITVAYKFKNGDTKEDFIKENFDTESMRLGKKIVDSITSEPHTAIVILNYMHTMDVNDMIKTYKAPLKFKKEKEPRKVLISSGIKGIYKMETNSRYKFED